MSLDGLRAWIGVVERKLGMRTRVFLVLAAIAIGGAGAAIYLALEAADDSVSKSEVQALQERVEGTAGEIGGGAEAAAVTALQAEVESLRTQVEELQGGTSSGGAAEKGGSTPGEGKINGGKPGSTGAGASGENGSGGAAIPKNQKQLEELVEKAKEKAGK